MRIIKTKNIFKTIVAVGIIFPMYMSAIAQTAVTTAKKEDSKSCSIHQEIDFTASPKQLYNALLSSKQFSECTKKSFDMFSAASARIDSTVGGTFSVFDGHIIGRIIELIPNQRIVEVWRVVDWPAGIYSIAEFQFKTNGMGAHLVFDHTGFPEDLKEHLALGWQEHYWDALTKYFERK